MDLIALSAAKNYANKVTAGFKSVEINGMNLIFTLLDDTKATIALPTPANGKDGENGKDGLNGVSVQDLSIDKDGSLLCHMSDGTTIDAGKVPMTDIELTDYYTKEETDVLLENSGLKTFIWDGLSSEENENNLALFEEFYADLIASQGKTRLLITTPNAQDPAYMNAEVEISTWGTEVSLNISTYPSWWSSIEDNSEEYNLSLFTAYVTIEDGKCIEVSELRDRDAELHFLSTTRQYDSRDYYTPISDGSPVSKGYMVETLTEGKYSVSPDQLEEEFQNLITEPIITIDDEDPTEIEFVRYEGETDGEYEFVYEDNWWGDGYRSTNGAHDNSYALGKFVLNNPGDKTIRVSIDYDLTCALGDTAAFSELDTELTANSWDDSTNVYKVITGETYTYGSIAYDLTPGEHFITFKYMVGWKDEGEGKGDSLMVSFGWTNGAVQEHHIATQQYVNDSIANINIPEVDLSNYYKKSEIGNITSLVDWRSDDTAISYFNRNPGIYDMLITSSIDDPATTVTVSGSNLEVLLQMVKNHKDKCFWVNIHAPSQSNGSHTLIPLHLSRFHSGETWKQFIPSFHFCKGELRIRRVECETWSPMNSDSDARPSTLKMKFLAETTDNTIATKGDISTAVSKISIPDMTNYYTKEEVNNTISSIPGPKTHDGEGMIGWYGTATAGTNLTESYGVTPDMVRAVKAGDFISWPSRVQTGATENTICLYNMTYEVYNKDEMDDLETIDIKIGKSPDVTYTYVIVGDNVYKETF